MKMMHEVATVKERDRSAEDERNKLWEYAEGVTRLLLENLLLDKITGNNLTQHMIEDW